jgi:ribokinase
MSASVAVVGSFVQDLAFRVNQFAQPGETRIGEFFTGPGGKGSNQAVACHRQGIKTIFIGAVAEDIFGTGYRSWSLQEEMPVSLESVDNKPTGAASIVVNLKGENQIIVALGANDSLSPEHVENTLSAQRKLEVVVTQAECNLSATRAALAYAKREQLYSIFNPAPINDQISLDLIQLASCITQNETECQFLLSKFAGKEQRFSSLEPTDDEVRQCTESLGLSTLLLTLGSKGSIFYCKSKAANLSDQVLRFPALLVDAIDTTGAGDAFNGGFAAGLVEFAGNFERAIKYATVVAALSTEKHGTAPAMPSKDQVCKYSSFYS